MDCSRGFIPWSAPHAFNRWPPNCATIRAPWCRHRVKMTIEDETVLETALNYTKIRFAETRRTEPLLVDPYISCLVPPNQIHTSRHTHPHCLATKWVDDKLLHLTSSENGPKQVVLLTDGMDTRPYRLHWPNSTLIFDVSPERIYKETASKLKGIGAKVPRGCLLLHVPMESFDLKQELYRRGYNGSSSSVWVIQEMPLSTLPKFENLLLNVGSLAAIGSTFLGELPSWLATTEFENEPKKTAWVEKLFMSHGFRVNVIDYEDVARSLGRDPPTEPCENILFTSEHLRFSDAQMEIWRDEIQRVEDEADEEGFEDL